MSDLSAIQLFGVLAPLFAALVAFILLQTVGEWNKRRKLRERSRKDLISELEQNKQYQDTSKFIALEDEGYKRFRQRGFLHELPADWQKELRELYAFVHEKNALLVYYRDVGLAAISTTAKERHTNEPLQRSKTEENLLVILGIIDTTQKQIVERTDKILPKLKSLLNDP